MEQRIAALEAEVAKLVVAMHQIANSLKEQAVFNQSVIDILKPKE